MSTQPTEVKIVNKEPLEAKVSPIAKDITVRLALIALAGSFITGLMTLGTQWISIQKQSAAAVAAEEVKETLADKTVVTDEKLESIHVLVNSDMGKQKLRTALALRRVASLTKNPVDIAAAEDAEQEYKKHQVRQSVVDNK